jgi:CheY-like chemotaxis protein
MTYPTACLFPTTTVFLDDHQEYLESLTEHLKLPRMKCRTFFDQNAALEYLSIQGEHHDLGSKWLRKTTSEDVFENTAMEICYDKIYKEIYNLNRFDITTALVIDYDMPSKNGLDFVRSIKDLPLKKILLTGIADTEIAINAVNENLINAYFKKEDEYLLSKLKRKLIECQHDFFIEQSKIVKNSLRTIGKNIVFDTPEFQYLFSRIIETSNAVEYYLIDDNCSYIFIDSNGAITSLFIKTKEQIDCERKSCDSFTALDPKNTFFYTIEKDSFPIDRQKIQLFREQQGL